jgi:hypothetical protein
MKNKRHLRFIKCVNILQRVFRVELRINYTEKLICISDADGVNDLIPVEIDRETKMTHVREGR